MAIGYNAYQRKKNDNLKSGILNGKKSEGKDERLAILAEEMERAGTNGGGVKRWIKNVDVGDYIVRRGYRRGAPPRDVRGHAVLASQ